jgi:type IV pilus assembly protein PilA
MTNRKGFTLIELLIVVVIIGILAAIAIPKFANTKEKAVVAGMKSDLRNLVTAQEAFFADNKTYATAIAATQGNTAGPACGGSVAFVQTAGNVAPTIAGCTAAGWAATISNPAVTTAAYDVCGIFVGDPATFAAAAGLAVTDNEGAPKCY